MERMGGSMDIEVVAGDADDGIVAGDDDVVPLLSSLPLCRN
jgi:hypothetical protein